MKKILLLIDCQYDFLDGGKLGVSGSTDKMHILTDYVRNHGNDYTMIVATADWHPFTHCSFKENGGMWPTHCVQHSLGAAIFEPLLIAINESANHFEVLTKGCDEDHEEYSIFKNMTSCDELIKLVERLDIEEIDVCGIALSYCVADTIKDGRRNLPNVQFNLLKNFCPDIGDGSAETIKKLEDINVKIVQ